MTQEVISEATCQQWPIWLEKFVTVYQALSIDNLECLSSIYHQNITFIDPIHRIEGYCALKAYFQSMYENLSQCNFVINNVITHSNQAAIYWQMTYVHPKLNKGRPVTVSGSSHIKGENDLVIFHRDYLDIGNMLYEQLPVIGKLVKWVKAKASN